MTKRVAIIGARGIGRHHAHWWTLEGANVCAFVGSSTAKLETTRDTLNAMFGFEGNSYADVAAMLDAEKPEIVDVCSPPDCHASHVELALRAGCDVLCEKPFIFDRGVANDVLLARARTLATMAEDLGHVLSVCTQYTVGTRLMMDQWASHHTDELLTTLACTLAAPANGRPHDPGRIWMDLAPHIVSVLLEAAPNGNINDSTLETHFRDCEAGTTFDWTLPRGRTVRCTLNTANTKGEPAHIRKVSFNKTTYTVEGMRDAKGVYGSRITCGAREIECEDFMRLLIRNFLEEVPAVTMERSIRNLELCLQLLERGLNR